MITAEERLRLDGLLGDLPRSPGVEERMLGGEQMHRFIAELVDKMEEQGVTQAELGRRMGVNRRQILRWVQADGSLKADTMFALARHLGFRLDALWVPIDAAQEQVQVERLPRLTMVTNPTVLRAKVSGEPARAYGEDDYYQARAHR